MGAGIMIQARLTSKRFPNKIMAMLKGKPVLKWVIDACAKTGLPITICIPTTKTNSGIVWFLQNIGGLNKTFEIHMGHEEDLALRLRQCNYMKYDPLVRICGDNPFMNPEDINIALELFKKRGKYTRVNQVEVFSRSELEYVCQNDPFITRREHCVNMLAQTVDYPEDIDRLEKEYRIERQKTKL